MENGNLTEAQQELQQHKQQWAVWKREFNKNKGKWEKVPINIKTGRHASIHDSGTKLNYETARIAYEAGLGDGIGFVFTENDPYIGIDIDKCRNLKTGKIADWAWKIIKLLDSYTEISWSGRGVHIIIRGKAPIQLARNRFGQVEVYADGRYFVMTGEHLANTSTVIEDRVEVLNKWLSKELGKKAESRLVKTTSSKTSSDNEPSDEEVIKRITSGVCDEKYRLLWNGDYEGAGYRDQSTADMAFAGYLVTQGCGSEQIDRLFRKSGLYRQKWDDKHFADGTTYGQRTINLALESRPEKEQKIQLDEAKEKAQEIVSKALASTDPTKVILGNQECIGTLALIRREDKALWGVFKSQLKGRVNLNDLEAAAKTQGLRLAEDDESYVQIPSLIEDSYGLIKQEMTQGGLVAKRLSNLKFEVKERLTSSDGEVLFVRVTFDGQETRECYLSHEAFLSARELLQGLGTTKAIFLGNDKDVQILRGHLLKQNPKSRVGVNVMGRHDDLVVMPDLTISRNGPVDDSPYRLVNTADNKLFAAVARKWPSKQDHLEAAKAIFRYLPLINEASVIAPAIAWVAALPFAKLIRKHPGWGGFPHLDYWGSAGSGKTAELQLLGRTTGIPLTFDLYSLPRTRFTRLLTYSSTNLIPVILDEYRPGNWSPSIISMIHHEFRSLYGGEIDERGMPSLKTASYPVVAPVIIGGEDRLRDFALNHRIIPVNPRKQTIDENGVHKEAFQKVHEATLEDYFLHYCSFALGIEDWLEHLEQARETVVKRCEEKGLLIPNRIINNLAIVRFGWQIFNMYADHLNMTISNLVDGTLDDAIDAVREEIMPQGKDNNALDDLMVIVATMVSNGRLRPGTHFVKTPDDFLVVPLTQVLPEVRHYARDTNYRGDILGDAAYRGLISEMVRRSDSYVKNTSFLGSFSDLTTFETQRRRGVLIDPYVLEDQVGIDVGVWGLSPANEGETAKEKPADEVYEGDTLWELAERAGINTGGF